MDENKKDPIDVALRKLHDEAWNAAIERAAAVAYDSEYVWDDKDAVHDGIRQAILKLRRF